MTEKSKSVEKVERPDQQRSPAQGAARQASVVPFTDSSSFAFVGRAAGNMAMQRLLQDGAIRAKLSMSQPGDASEREADSVADRIVSGNSKTTETPCVCGGQAGGDCPQCNAKSGTLQLKPIHSAAPSSIPATGLNVGAGSPLDTTTRDFMESRFGLGFGDVQVHTGAESAESAASINARAYTIGTDIVFGANQYAPGTSEGKRLLAHELTHIAQQRVGGVPALQRQADAAPAASPAPAPDRPDGLIVDDAVTEPAPHQMKRSEFVAQTRSAVTVTAIQALATSPFGAPMLPQVNSEIKKQFALYSGLDSRALENMIRAQVPAARGATTAAGLIPPICEVVRQNIVASLPKPAEFVTGFAGTAMNTVSTIREGIGTVTDTVGSTLSSIGSGAASTIGSILFKAREGGAQKTDNAGGIRTQLGGGSGLDGRVRESMSSAFGHDFGDVRVHTDTGAARIADQLNARAFTIGRDIAFAAGEYKPGTLIGDALIAHELAHVAQQRGAASESIMPNAPSNEDAFEEDADSAAVRAVIGLWSGAQGLLPQIQRSAMPALRSGLKLRRCDDKTPTPQPTETKEPDTPKPAPPAPRPLEPLTDELQRTGKSKKDALEKVINDLQVNRDLLEGGTMHLGMVFSFGKTFTPFGFKRTKDDQGLALKLGVGKNKKSYVAIDTTLPFSTKGWSTLYATVYHEYQHVLQAAAKKDIIAPVRNKGYIGNEQEAEAYARDIILSNKLIENKLVEAREAEGVKQTINDSWEQLSKYWGKVRSPSKDLKALYNQAKEVKDSLK